jgi:hypothetical protein
MQLSLYLEYGERFSRAAQKLPQYTPVDIDSTLLDCGIEILPIAASHYVGPDHLPGIEFPYPEMRVVFKLKERPCIAAAYSIDVFVTDATLSLISHAEGHTHVEVNRRYPQVERYISNKKNGLLELVGCSHKTLIDRLSQTFIELRTAYLTALQTENVLPVPRHIP